MPDTPRLGVVAADRIQRLIRHRPDAVLGFATGSSPIAVYEELALRVAARDLDLTEARGFALDEYIGLAPDDPQSYASFIRERVERPLGMREGTVRVPDGTAADPRAGGDDFEAAICDAGGIDLQILGLGANGHVGFNEPGSSLGSRTRVKTLAARTRADNARFFDHPELVPRLCITQGLATISEARTILVVATGAAKARAVAAVTEGPVTSMCPGSVLQHHPRVTLVVDEAAASGLALIDYHRSVQIHSC